MDLLLFQVNQFESGKLFKIKALLNIWIIKRMNPHVFISILNKLGQKRETVVLYARISEIGGLVNLEVFSEYFQ